MLSNKAGYLNFENVFTENQPFPGGTLGCNQFRIPGIIRLSNGNLFAVTDARWDDAKSDYGGIDTMCSVSKDGGKTWQPSFVAYFPDSNGTPVEPADTTACIDSCVVQDKNDRVHIIVNMNPTGITTGLKWPGNGSGFIDINGEKYLSVVNDYSLTDTQPQNIPKDKLFYVDKDCRIVSAISGVTGYSVDSYFNLYKNGQPIYQKQIDSDDEIQQNIFYRDSDFHVYNTMYSLHLYSDDCKNWNTEIISDRIKTDADSGFISSPGNGTLTSNGTLLFPFYGMDTDNHSASLIIYSEDNGTTWNRTPIVPTTKEIQMSGECKIIELDRGLWRLFFRNQIKKICYADYNLSENKWENPVILPITVHSECNFSAIMSKGKIIMSYPAGKGENAMGRVNGRLYIFDIDDSFNMTLIEDKLIEENAFSYSCLVERQDGKICVLFDTCDGGIVEFRIL